MEHTAAERLSALVRKMKIIKILLSRGVVIALSVIMLMSGIIANASDGAIVTNDVEARSNRIFDVQVMMKSPKILSAASFELSYNVDKLSFREVKANAPVSKVRAYDDAGKTKVVFLCENGLKLGNAPLLFTVRYKLISDENAEIKITASDCVDVKAKNFSTPTSATCKVTTIGGSVSGSSRSGTSGRSFSGSAKSKVKSLDGSKTKSIAEDDNPDSDDSSDDDYEKITTPSKDGNNAFLMIIFAIMILVVAALILILNIFKLKYGKKNGSRGDE